ncbi:actin-like ATPase domain-containing protein [Aaosphaeria arxii CBS 175.79]|uniref:Actin-like ATPase domain-containing protein n=1 Tax=Aaosphaeria arxii CBS 175.79 TaxID=1450172 RepID=A0A6A5XG57_9PLEO|nr:actin-like ATPase domain-containing protein [Aaosphaeria arxii CBS 175.79]KAF2011913.1 actin-like ATPase domain-containing protein [Aaosphaeria arxii CBS 175.79]
MSSRRIIVSIDFGTTFSGLAWAETNRADHQYVIDKWPSNTSSTTSPKVPTELRKVNEGFQWGFEIPRKAKRNKYFKLKLDDPISTTTDTRPPEELTQLYLSYLYKHMVSVLEERLSSSVVRDTPLDFILTVPAIWSQAAKQKTETAAVRAGFKGARKIHLVSEPEAAAIYTLHSLGAPTLRVGATFVVCDAGGGTVDLISYKVQQLSPKLKVKEATEGTGGKCGSSMLNNRFRRFLKQKLGEDYWTADRLVEGLNTFEDYKKTFTPNGEPLSLRVELPNDPARDIRRNRFRIKQRDMQQEIFEPIIKDVINLVQEQISMAGSDVAAVLLVGGFGQSEYLKDRIQTSVGSAIRVLQPSNGWTAVVQGAAMIGLTRASANLAQVNISERVARKHYGTELVTSFEAGVDEECKKFWYEKWNCWAVKKMHWFIEKGVPYPEDRPSTISCNIDFPVRSGADAATTISVYVNSADRSAPRYMNANTTKVATLNVDVGRVGFGRKLFSSKKKRMADGHWYYQFKAFIEAAYESADIRYTLKLKDKTHDVIRVDYD